MQHIGITGGIGSGKTTICHIFEQFGIPIYYADDRAKQLMVSQPDIIQALKHEFGEAVYTSTGELNRAYLSAIVFNDPLKLAALNSITHPIVFQDVMRWQEAQSKLPNPAPYTLKEAAVLVESGAYKQLDKLIVVTAPVAMRIARTMQRDHADRTTVLARIEKQLTDEEKLPFADYVIHNDGTQSLVQQVWKIHQSLCNLLYP